MVRRDFKLRWMLGAILLAMGACTAQWQMTQKPDVWEAVCADVAAAYEVETCEDYDRPDIVRNSIFMQQMIDSFGVMMYDEWRLYLAPVWFIEQYGWTEEIIAYHEMVHAVLDKEVVVSRCESERIAREMTDARYGTDSAGGDWEITYQCVGANQLL